MKNVVTYDKFKPFKSFNPYVSAILKGLDEIYVRDDNNMVTGVIDKNAGKLDIVSEAIFDNHKITRMVVEIRYINNELKIMINKFMTNQVEYLKYLCDTYCDKAVFSLDRGGLGEDERSGKFEIWTLKLEQYNEFINDLTNDALDMYYDSNKYNL